MTPATPLFKTQLPDDVNDDTKREFTDRKDQKHTNRSESTHSALSTIDLDSGNGTSLGSNKNRKSSGQNNNNATKSSKSKESRSKSHGKTPSSNLEQPKPNVEKKDFIKRNIQVTID